MSNFMTRLVSRIEDLRPEDTEGQAGIITDFEMKNLPPPQGNIAVKLELEVSPAIAQAILSATYEKE